MRTSGPTQINLVHLSSRRGRESVKDDPLFRAPPKAVNDMRKGNCTSCGQGLLVKGSTSLPCPNCDEILYRCGSCREQAVAYMSACGYAGP